MAKSIRKRVDNLVLSILTFTLFIFFSACSVQKAQKTLLASSSLKGAHIGIAVYNDTKQNWVSQYQSDHYFSPASNTKILSTYLGLAYLGDSLPGWSMSENTDTLFLIPQGDPSFLHPDFNDQPLLALIKNSPKKVVIQNSIQDHFESFGNGWAWNDFAEDYQPERSRMPIYGNVVHFYRDQNNQSIKPFYFIKSNPNLNVGISNGSETNKWSRSYLQNNFYPTDKKNTASYYQVPFTSENKGLAYPIQLLQDTLNIAIASTSVMNSGREWKTIKTVPTDSFLKIMMSRSDNFFAEQVVLMSSQQVLGKMDDAAFIDKVLKSDFSALPQPIRWVDGSGLSRYNLNTPENFVYLLKKMTDQFGETRIKNIFAKGGEGTLSAYFKNFPGELYAKTGSLGNQIALSGFIITLKGQKLYFSVLVSNHMSPTSAGVRKAVEKYLSTIAQKN